MGLVVVGLVRVHNPSSALGLGEEGRGRPPCFPCILRQTNTKWDTNYEIHSPMQQAERNLRASAERLLGLLFKLPT